MARYRFTARNQARDRVTGEMEGSGPGLVADRLMSRGLFPVEIVERREVPEFLQHLSRFVHGPLRFEDRVFFVRQMYSIVRGGIPIHQGVRTLAESSRHPELRHALRDCRVQLEEGRSFSLAMANHPTVFSQIMVSIVRVGEETGRLDEAFRQLQRNLEADHATERRIKSAMRYPALVIGAIALAFVIVNLFVIPAFSGVFAGFGAELPPVTRGLIATSEFMKTQLPMLAVFLALSGLGLRAYLRTANGQLVWGRAAVRLPLIGSILLKSTLSRFSRILSMCARSGIVLDQALAIAADATRNRFFAARLLDMRDGVARGESLSSVSRQSKLFTPLVLQMITIGEESGSLEDMLDEAAEFYEREVEHEVTLLGDYMEPVLLIFVSVLVLLLALGIFLPMWDMASVAIRR